jgi:hypothetical protein
MMRELAAEMNRISFMMEREDVTEEEMRDLKERITKIQGKIQGL